MRRLVSCICAVIMMISCFCVPSISSSAADTPDFATIVNNSYIGLIDKYGWSDSAFSSDLTIVSGYFYYSSGDYSVKTIVYRVGNLPLICTYQSEFDSYSYDMASTAYQCYFQSDRVGDGNLAWFYFNAESGYYQLFSFFSTSSASYDSFLSYYNNSSTDIDITHNLVSGSTYGDLSAEIDQTFNPPEPTEPSDSGSSGGFELPQDWIDGGHTLETVEPITFDGVDPSAALDQFESMQDDVSLDESFGNGVGLFWAILEGAIDALGIWSFVVVIMIFVIIRFVLGR